LWEHSTTATLTATQHWNGKSTHYALKPILKPFSQKKVAAPAKQSASANHAKSAQIASNTPSLMMSALAFGAACPNVNVAGSSELVNQIVAGSWLYCPPFL
jgi:hypothetical protein